MSRKSYLDLMAEAERYGFGVHVVGFVKRVETFRSSTGQVVTQHHRGYYARVSYKGRTERCGHFHQKPGPARQCGNRLGKRMAAEEES